MWITNEFKSLEQIKGIVRLIKNKDVLEKFKLMNKERLIPLFVPKSNVLRYEEGDFCSNCNYKFIREEANYHYCVNCLEELACCDDELCDKDWQRAEESMISFLDNIYERINKH